MVQFLDVEFDLENNSYKPYIKENDVPLYVHQKSNHPPAILKNIPAAVNKRLSGLSSSEQMFQSVAPIFQETKRKRNKRNVLWFNPPYSKTIKTNVGGQFLKLLSKHFPKSHILNKVFNRKTVKVSYRNAPNMKKIISTHNQKILRNSEKPAPEGCNCTKGPCPFGGKCQMNNLVYQATVKSENETETYVGLTATTFKARWSNHETGFKYSRKRTSTSLSNYIWDLKDKQKDYSIEWKMLGRAKPFSPISEICNLCTLEKWHILFTPEMATLNRKEELNNYCLHKKPILLDKT